MVFGILVFAIKGNMIKNKEEIFRRDYEQRIKN